MTTSPYPKSTTPQPKVSDSILNVTHGIADAMASPVNRSVELAETLARMTGLPEGTRPELDDVVTFVHDLKRARKRTLYISGLLTHLASLYDEVYPERHFLNPFFLANISMAFARDLRVPGREPRKNSCSSGCSTPHLMFMLSFFSSNLDRLVSANAAAHADERPQ